MLSTIEVTINAGQISPIEPMPIFQGYGLLTLLTSKIKDNNQMLPIKNNTPTIAEFIAELESIQAEHPIDLIAPVRTNRDNAVLE